MDKTTNILIVDDNEINRDTLKGLCESLGHTTLLAESGSEALDLIRLSPQPDLVLLDVLMPEMDGYQVLLEIKGNQMLRSIPVIMVSVVEEMRTIVQCIEDGADDYLTKPFNAILLKARINACLVKKRLHDQEVKFNKWVAESYHKLQKVEEGRDTLFKMIVHDLNSPLSVITDYADRLLLTEQGEQSAGKQQEYIENIRNASVQIRSLVRQILDVVSLEQGKMAIRLSELDMSELGREICSQLVCEVEKKQGSIKCLSSPETIHCSLDRGLVCRILQNLIINSIKYTPPGQSPEIQLDIRQIEDNILLTITDNGEGIAADQQNKIFSRFYQVDTGSGERVKGLGLGLAFCKMAAEAMNGSIRVESAPGRGAKFIVELPCAKQ